MFHVEHCKLEIKTYRGRPPFGKDGRGNSAYIGRHEMMVCARAEVEGGT